MPFVSTKILAQGHLAPANTLTPYPIKADYGYVLLWSTLTPSNTSTLLAGHIVTATIRQSGTQPVTNTSYPTINFHTYTYTRNGRTGDVLGAELPAPQNFLLNTNYIVTLRINDSTGTLIGLSTATTISFI